MRVYTWRSNKIIDCKRV